MANLIIKPTSGGSLILQDEGGTAAHTMDASGNHTLANNTTLSGTANNLGTVTAGNVDAITDCKTMASGAITASAYMDIQQCFTSDYKFYKLFVGGFETNSVAYLEVQYLNSSNAAVSDTYYSLANGGVTNGGAAGNARWSDTNTHTLMTQNDTDGFRTINTWTHEGGNTGHEGCTLEMFFYDPVRNAKDIVTWTCTFSQAAYVGREDGWGMAATAAQHYGIRLHPHTGNFVASGHFAVVGYKL